MILSCASNKGTSVLFNIRMLVFVAASTISPISWSSENLFTATYKGRHSGIGIKLVRELEQKSDSDFVLKSKATSFIGSITERSEFERSEGLLIPHKYDYTRKVFGSESLQALHFNWETMQANFRREDKPHKNKGYSLLSGALDPSLYQLKLQQELFKGKHTFSFDFAKGGKMKKMEFQRLEKPTTYKLGDKEYVAVEVERINQPDKKRTNILLIPTLSFQIAKITHTEEDGSKYQIQLIDFESDTTKLADFYHSLN